MTYRRGFQRVYALLTVAWIGLVLLTVLPGYWRPWLAASIWEMDLRPNTPTHSISVDEIDVPATAKLEVQTRRIWALGLSVIPPLVLYLSLFLIAPWIIRGFRPGTQI